MESKKNRILEKLCSSFKTQTTTNCIRNGIEIKRNCFPSPIKNMDANSNWLIPLNNALQHKIHSFVADQAIHHHFCFSSHSTLIILSHRAAKHRKHGKQFNSLSLIEWAQATYNCLMNKDSARSQNVNPSEACKFISHKTICSAPQAKPTQKIVIFF